MTDGFDAAEIARVADAAATSIAGVRQLYSAAPGAVRAARQLASGTEPVPLSSVTVEAEAVAVLVSVGIDATRSAAETARTVADAVREALRAGPTAELAAGARIHVRVSRIALPA